MSLAADQTSPSSGTTSSASSGNGSGPSHASPAGPVANSPQAAAQGAAAKGRGFRSLLFNLLIPLLILAVGSGIVVALGSIEPKARPADDESIAGRMRRLPPAEVMKVLSLEEIGKSLELRVDGVVVPYREIEVAAEVAGQIVKKSPACEAGNFVRKGDLLVEIDATDYQQEVERLTRMREQDYEAIKEVDQELANTRRLIEIAQQDVSLQEREVKRLESMPAGFASEGELDRARKALLAAMQNRIGFENQMNLLAARRSKLEAAERLATTELRGAEINLERTKIHCPVDGVIVRENVELNSFIQRGSPIVTLDDVSKVEVAINLRMDQLLWVLDQRSTEATFNDTSGRNDQPSLPELGGDSSSIGYSIPPTPALIEYEVAGRSDTVYRWNGMLLRYDGIGLDPRSRTVPVVVVVDNPRQFEGADSESLRAASPSPLVRGMFVNVRLMLKPNTPLVAVPSIAIQPGNRVWQFVPDDSVLDAMKPAPSRASGSGASGSGTGGSPAAASPSVTPATAARGTASADLAFDPDLWQAGRVVIRNDVIAVDSLWLPASEDERGPADSDPAERRYWICEIAGGEVVGGSWVVSSPLGDFDSETAVRVPVTSLK